MYNNYCEPENVTQWVQRRLVTSNRHPFLAFLLLLPSFNWKMGRMRTNHKYSVYFYALYVAIFVRATSHSQTQIYRETNKSPTRAAREQDRKHLLSWGGLKLLWERPAVYARATRDDYHDLFINFCCSLSPSPLPVRDRKEIALLFPRLTASDAQQLRSVSIYIARYDAASCPEKVINYVEYRKTGVINNARMMRPRQRLSRKGGGEKSSPGRARKTLTCSCRLFNFEGVRADWRYYVHLCFLHT